MGAHAGVDAAAEPRVSLPPTAWMVVGLGWGDEGKGSIVDALTRRTGARVNVRFNGGPQAAHHVVTPDGRLHCFSQIGAGSFSPGVETYLGPGCFVDPLALQLEIAALAANGVPDCGARVRIHPDCPLLTPWHGLLNRIVERTRGAAAHGSCGRGIGALLADLKAHPLEVPRAADLAEPGRLAHRLVAVRERMLALAAPLAAAHAHDPPIRRWLDDLHTPEMPGFVAARCRDLLAGPGPRLAGLDWLRRRAGGDLIFEGAQGALLDMDQGDWPHVTPSATTAAPAQHLLDAIGFAGRRVKLGVLRAYATRHGAGPFVSETPGLAARLPEPHNRDDGWQGPMRVGWLDLVALRRALAANGGVDGLALTCLDRVAGLADLSVCDGYLEIAGATPKPSPELEPWVARDAAGAIVRVSAPPAPARAARAALTGLLAACRPRLRPVSGGADSLAALLAGPAGATLAPTPGDPLSNPVLACLSSGPTATDKRWLRRS